MDLTKLGGKPGLTKSLRIQYGKYNIEAQTNGEAALPWDEWLNQNGYELDKAGLAQPSQARADEIARNARPYL